MKPTKEQIDAALVAASIYVETCRHDMSRHTANAFATILSSIPALTAELEVCARQRDAWKDKNATTVEAHAAVLRELEAERAAHEQAKRDYDAALTEAAESLRMCQRKIDEVKAWQTATGHASPEAYRASKVEPGADVIELTALGLRARQSLLRNVGNASTEEQFEHAIRAVVVALAEMGVEVMPTDQACQYVAVRAFIDNDVDQQRAVDAASDAVRSFILSRLAPVLGARRVLELPSESVEPTKEAELAAHKLMRRFNLAGKVASGLPVAALEKVTIAAQREAITALCESYAEQVAALAWMAGRLAAAPAPPTDESPSMARGPQKITLDVSTGVLVVLPSDEQLAEEAARYANRAANQEPTGDDRRYALDALAGNWTGTLWYDAVRAYVAGARREGLR